MGMFKRSPLPMAIGLLCANAAMAETTKLEPMVIIGSGQAAQQLPGSADVVDEKQMETENITDINQAMKTVPGVYVREEDGFGLRPNIGIRSAAGGRSSKVTLMEDGVLTAPAPYSNPAAYYFPTTLRMSSVEILKGAPLLRHGPQTTGGVINLRSTPIPRDNSGSATFSAGSFGSTDLHAHYGGRQGQWSWLVETAQRNSEGFKEIDRSNRDSGYDIEDYVAKLRWESAEGPRQSVLLKAQHSEEISNETYLGLTDADFDDDPDRRYGLSSIDQMDNEHTGFSLTYERELTDRVNMTALAYRNDFARDWFKLDGGGSLIDDANAGDATAQGILDGTTDATDLEYKHNDREYYSQGVELNFDMLMGDHLVALGGRLHEDEMDRFQPVEVYDQVNGSLVFQNTQAPTGSNNRLEQADALALWLVDEWRVNDDLNVNLALRYEDVETSRVEYADPSRATVAEKRSNDSAEWLPGASFTYDINDSWQALAGVHRGFAPLGGGARENEEPETRSNWEFGGRYRSGAMFAEVIGFYSDFSDKTENCSVGSPCSNGATSGTFQTGEAVVAGIESQLGTRFQAGDFTVPVALTYTYTDAEISEDNAVAGVQDGDRLRDIPENKFSARLGLEHAGGWNNYLVAKYYDETCVTVGCERKDAARGETESLFVVDLISRYRLANNAEAFLKAENVFDEQSIVSRSPYGARPNKPRVISVGMTVDF